jgi:hypothetical protein
MASPAAPMIAKAVMVQAGDRADWTTRPR